MMSPSFQTEEQAQLWQIVQHINAAWVNNRTEDLLNYLHPDIVITAPDLHENLSGINACIKSYKDFVSNSVLKDYKESDPVINIFPNTAVVSYQFDITYEMNGKTYSEKGRDLFVFTKENDKWLAVWRTLMNVESIKN
jgi:hypothetical protein